MMKWIVLALGLGFAVAAWPVLAQDAVLRLGPGNVYNVDGRNVISAYSTIENATDKAVAIDWRIWVGDHERTKIRTCADVGVRTSAKLTEVPPKVRVPSEEVHKPWASMAKVERVNRGKRWIYVCAEAWVVHERANTVREASACYRYSGVYEVTSVPGGKRALYWSNTAEPCPDYKG